MATKRKRLFLSLAIACFAGIVAIFVFDGYIGIYDTVYVTTGEFTQEIGPDFWQGQRISNSYPYQMGVKWGDSVQFRYEIENRNFSDYVATVEASVWKSNEKVIDLFQKDVSIPNFDKTAMDWTLSVQDLEKAGLGAGEYTIKIKRGEVELGQGIVLGFYVPQQPGGIEIVPPPPRRG